MYCIEYSKNIHTKKKRFVYPEHVSRVLDREEAQLHRLLI